MNNNVIHIDSKKIQKMVFIYNSLQDGWLIKKKGEKYIFSKKHQGKKEILDESFLSSFIEQNSRIKINLD